MSEKGPTSEDLNRTVDLLAGLGDERPETGEFSDRTVLSGDTLGPAFFKVVLFYSQQSTEPVQKVEGSLVLSGSF